MKTKKQKEAKPKGKKVSNFRSMNELQTND